MKRWTATAVVVVLCVMGLIALIGFFGGSAGASSDTEPAASSALPTAVPPTAATPQPTSAVPASPASSTATAVPVARDRVDRAWPKHPPWDGCPRPVWPGATNTGLPGEGRRILLLGDSLTRETRVRTQRLLSKSGWTPTFRCWGSKRLDWGLDQVSRARSLHQLPDWVVVALGTNDISWETQATTQARVRKLLDRLGPDRQVLWVDLHLTRSAWLDARADWFNSMVDSMARRRPNLTVVHWHRAADKARIRGYDGIHYAPYGYKLRADFVTAAINERARELAASHPVIGPEER